MSGKEGGSSMEGQMRTRKGASMGGEREGRKDRWMDQWVESIEATLAAKGGMETLEGRGGKERMNEQ